MVNATEIEKIGELAHTLKKFGEQEQQIILTFEERLSSIYPHTRYVKQLIELSKALRGKDDAGIRREMYNLCTKIRTEVLTKFADVIQYAEKERELLGEESKVLSVTESILANELALIARGKLLGPRAQKQTRAIVAQLQKAVEQERKGRSIIEQLNALLEHLLVAVGQQKALIAHEVQTLEIFENPGTLNEANKERLEDAEKLLEKIAYSIEQSVRREKNEFIVPFNKFLKKKISVEALAHKRVAGATKISLADIKADLRKLTRPEEITAYMTELFEHAHLLDEKARKGLKEFVRKSENLRRTVQERGIIDQTTGVFKRDHYEDEIEAIMGNAIQKNQPIAFLLIDIDHFKQFNDTYGHALGDVVLTFVGKVLAVNKKADDLVFRYGGEEFLIILPNTMSSDAFTAAERFRVLIEHKSRPFLVGLAQQNPELEEKGLMNQKITISGGVVCYLGGETMIDQKEYRALATTLVKMADANLYAAKKRGRNCIQTFPKTLSYRDVASRKHFLAPQ